MKAAVVRELEKQQGNQLPGKIKILLLEKPFADNSAVVQWLKALFLRKIAGRARFQEFGKAVSADTRNILKVADQYYQQLFNKNGYINEHTAAQESDTPYTDIVCSVYNSLFKNDRSCDESLIIYSELRNYLKSSLGHALAVDLTLQTFKIWTKIDQLLELQHVMYRAWIESIPSENIKAEKANFDIFHQVPVLSKVANLGFTSRNNEAAARQYLIRLKRSATVSPFQFIKDATKEADSVRLKGSVALQKRLIQRLGVKELLLFMDALKYPVLQDSVLQEMNNSEDFEQTLKQVISCPGLKTKRGYLLVMVLNNYFDFIHTNLRDLDHLSKPGYGDEKKPEHVKLKKKALKEYELWTSDKIPQSFCTILNTIFSKKELFKSKFFLLFFQWISSFSKLYITNQSMEAKGKVIDIVNELFQQRLNILSEDRYYLINNLPLSQLNDESLGKLVNIYHENRDDQVFRDKVQALFTGFITSDKFYWNAEGDVNLNQAINNAYHFSLLLSSYDDKFSKWKQFFNEQKTVHNGWLTSTPNYKRYQKESFLLTAGIGMAYYKYSTGSPTEASELLFLIVDQILIQHRNASDHHNVNYHTPLQFAAITIAEYQSSIPDRFLNLIVLQLDDLKLLLKVIHELTHRKGIKISKATMTNISGRINRDFWMIENSKKDVELKPEFKYYDELRKEILKPTRRLSS